MQASDLVTDEDVKKAHAASVARFWEAPEHDRTDSVTRAALEAVALDLYERGLRDAAKECTRRETTAMERATYFGPFGNGWRTHCGGASGASVAHAEYKRIAAGWHDAAEVILKLRSAT